MVSKMQLDILEAIADIQHATSMQTVEDTQIAEELDLELSLVHQFLQTLAKEDYIRLDKVKRLSGKGYTVSLLAEGNVLVQDLVR
jgi:Mn-dependent DtxR family transcriptional regulator